jgi:hypothetical protein
MAALRGGGGHVFFAKYNLNLAYIYPIFSSLVCDTPPYGHAPHTKYN